MSPPQLRDPLVRHYFELVVMIEQLVLTRVPRLPLMPAPKPLDACDILDVAQRFAAAHKLATDGEPKPVDSDPLVEAPGFGVTNREYWPLWQVKAAEEAATGQCGICEIDWRLCRGLYDQGLPRCCSDCTHDLHAKVT